MKKYLRITFISVFVLGIAFSQNIVHASVIDDVLKEVKSLKSQVTSLRSQLGAMVAIPEDGMYCYDEFHRWVQGIPVAPDMHCLAAGGTTPPSGGGTGSGGQTGETGTGSEQPGGTGGGGQTTNGGSGIPPNVPGGSIPSEFVGQTTTVSEVKVGSTDIAPIIKNIASGDTTQVVKLQQVLKSGGLYNGNIDGQFGPKTQAAINKATAQKTKPAVTSITKSKKLRQLVVLKDALVNKPTAIPSKNANGTNLVQQEGDEAEFICRNNIFGGSNEYWFYTPTQQWIFFAPYALPNCQGPQSWPQ